MEIGYKYAHLQAPLTPNKPFCFGRRHPNGQKTENKQIMEKLNVILHACHLIWFSFVSQATQQHSQEELLFFIHNKAISKRIL